MAAIIGRALPAPRPAAVPSTPTRRRSECIDRRSRERKAATTPPPSDISYEAFFSAFAPAFLSHVFFSHLLFSQWSASLHLLSASSQLFASDLVQLLVPLSAT